MNNQLVEMQKRILAHQEKYFTFFHELFREYDDKRVAIVKATRFVMDLKTKKLRDVLLFFKEFLEL